MSIIGAAIIGAGAGLAGGTAIVAVAEAIVRRRNRLPKQTAEDRAFDAEMAAQLQQFESWVFDHGAVIALREANEQVRRDRLARLGWDPNKGPGLFDSVLPSRGVA
jgi:hypothetical protein